MHKTYNKLFHPLICFISLIVLGHSEFAMEQKIVTHKKYPKVIVPTDNGLIYKTLYIGCDQYTEQSPFYSFAKELCDQGLQELDNENYLQALNLFTTACLEEVKHRYTNFDLFLKSYIVENSCYGYALPFYCAADCMLKVGYSGDMIIDYYYKAILYSLDAQDPELIICRGQAFDKLHEYGKDSIKANLCLTCLYSLGIDYKPDSDKAVAAFMKGIKLAKKTKKETDLRQIRQSSAYYMLMCQFRQDSDAIEARAALHLSLGSISSQNDVTEQETDKAFSLLRALYIVNSNNKYNYFYQAYNGAKILLKQGKTELALKYFKQLARDDHLRAVIKMIKIYTHPAFFCGPETIASTICYIKKAACLGSTEMMYALGRLYTQGNNQVGFLRMEAQKDFELAKYYLEPGVAKNDGDCCALLGCILYLEKKKADAKKLFNQAINSPSATGATYLNIYNLYIHDKDSNTAEFYLNKLPNKYPQYSFIVDVIKAETHLDYKGLAEFMHTKNALECMISAFEKGAIQDGAFVVVPGFPYDYTQAIANALKAKIMGILKSKNANKDTLKEPFTKLLRMLPVTLSIAKNG